MEFDETKTVAYNGLTLEITKRLRKERSKQSRVYFFDERVKETVGEQLVNRRSRPYKEYRKMLPAVFEAAGIEPMKSNWSQKAGCSMCPCSPGFILSESTHCEFFVTIK